MNGVAKEFWSEVFDLSAPVSDEADGGGGKTKRSKSRRKRVRKTQASRPPRTSAA